MGNEEKEINKLFEDDNKFFKKLRKEKLKIYVRNTLVTVLSSVIIIYSLMAGLTYLMYSRMGSNSSELSNWYNITGANLEVGGIAYDYTPFGGTGNAYVIKELQGRPLLWQEIKIKQFLFGRGNQDYYSIAMNGYNIRTGEKEMMFYLPSGNYSSYANDIALLDKIESNKIIEMGISFDKAYTIDQLKQILPQDKVTWLCVDTYSKKEAKVNDYTISAGLIHGFKIGRNKSLDNGAKLFIDSLSILLEDEGRYSETALWIKENISPKEEIKVDDLKIIGAVVVGTPNDLREYNKLPFVKATSLGATIDIY